MTLKEMEDSGYFLPGQDRYKKLQAAKHALESDLWKEDVAVGHILDYLDSASDDKAKKYIEQKQYQLYDAMKKRKELSRTTPMAVGAHGAKIPIPDIKDIEKALGIEEGTIFEYGDNKTPKWLNINTSKLKEVSESFGDEKLLGPILNALREGQTQRDRSIQMEGYDPVKYKQDASMLSNIGTDIPGYLSSSLMGILAPRSKEGIITKGKASDTDIGLDVAAGALSVLPLGAVASRVPMVARNLTTRPGLFKFIKSGLDASTAPLGEEILDAAFYDDEDNPRRSDFNLSDVVIGSGVNIGAPKLVKSGIDRVAGAAAGLGNSQGNKIANSLSDLIDDPVAQNLNILARARKNVAKGGTPKGTASGLFSPERYVSDAEYQKSLDALLLNEMKGRGYFKTATDPKARKKLQEVYNAKYPLDDASRKETLGKIRGSTIDNVSQTKRFESGIQDRPLEQLAAYKDLKLTKEDLANLKKNGNLKDLDVDLKLMRDYGLTPEGNIGKRQPTWDADLSNKAKLKKVRAFENRWGFDPSLRAIDPKSSALSLSKTANTPDDYLSKKANDYTDEYIKRLSSGDYLKPTKFSEALEELVTSDPDLARIVRYGSGAGNIAKDLARLGIVSGITNKIGKQFDFSFIPGMNEVVKYNREQLEKKLKKQRDDENAKHNEALEQKNK